MSSKITFSYYYGQEADALSFYRIPKLLFTCEHFRNLAVESKVLYGLMLDRMSLSIKNKWFDEGKRAYIYFSVDDTMEMLGCKKNKAMDMIKALEDIGLIERKRQGQGKPAVIYVKSFMEEDTDTDQRFEKSTSEPVENEAEVGNLNLLRFEKQTSRGLKNKPLEGEKTNPNKNKYNNTELNDPDLILSMDGDRGLDEYGAYASMIRENLEIDCLYQQYPYDRELLDGIYDLVLETVLCKGGNIVIASNEYPMQLVKSKFLKLNSSHIQYVIDSMKSSTSKVRNIKKYLLAALFNAPSTMNSYYQAAVNHDFPQYVGSL